MGTGADQERALVARGRDLLARLGAGSGDAADRAVGELVDAYGDPARGYHDLRHLTEVLDHVDELAASAGH
ncbi:MAG: hypothetical protein ACXVYH_14905, partial [Oryzihumus sp.]